MKKVTVISEDLAGNCLTRAYALARILQRKNEVKIIGPAAGGIIYPGCDDGKFDYFRVDYCRYPGFLSSVNRLLRAMDGDVLLPVKLKPTSFGISLLKKISARKPVVLDISDWELALFKDMDWKQQSKRELVEDPNSYLYTLAMEKLVYFADEVIVSSAFLQEKFGGHIVPHGRDTEFFDAARFNRDQLRREFGIEPYKVILFCGKPTKYSGLEDIISALDRLGNEAIRLMIVGADQSNPVVRNLLAIGKRWLIIEDLKPWDDVPKYLTAADLVVLPNKPGSFVRAYMPGKLYDAMAVSKPIIAYGTSDIPAVLEGCGIVVEPGDIDGLSAQIQWVLDHPQEAAEMGRRARARCVERYSWDAMERTLTSIIDKVLGV